ncbi:hypothetical protein L7F22_027880 [Adiantum nelumboides]|nr:hypothetical protein [Adiantum nelumboides]
MLSIATAVHCSHSFSKGCRALDSYHPPLLGFLCKQFRFSAGRRITFQPLGSRLPCRVYKEGDGGSGDGRGGMGGSGGSGGPGDGAFGKAGGIGVFSSLWARYVEILEEHPLIIKSLTAGILNLFADLVCQSSSCVCMVEKAIFFPEFTSFSAL